MYMPYKELPAALLAGAVFVVMTVFSSRQEV
jgi:hypothetical protein